MEEGYFGDKFIICKDKDLAEGDVWLDDQDLVCLYFAASWCVPSKLFTEYLIKEFYNEVNWDTSIPKKLEIIYISMDKNDDFEESCRSMPWLAYPQDSDKAKEFKSKFKITAIPTLIVMTPDGQHVITEKGRHDVVNKQEDAFTEWNNHGFTINRRERKIEEENEEEQGEELDNSRSRGVN